MDTCGNNKQIEENRVKEKMTPRIFNVGKCPQLKKYLRISSNFFNR